MVVADPKMVVAEEVVVDLKEVAVVGEEYRQMVVVGEEEDHQMEEVVRHFQVLHHRHLQKWPRFQEDWAGMMVQCSAQHRRD